MRPDPSAAFAFIKWETTNPQVTATFAQLVANLPQLKKVPSFPLAKDARFQVFINEASSPTPTFGLSCPTPRSTGCACARPKQSALFGNTTCGQGDGLAADRPWRAEAASS